MEPAVLAGPPAAVSGQETLPGKVVGEGAARISLSHCGWTNPAWRLEPPSRMAWKCRNWRETNSELSDFPIPVDSSLQGISLSVLTMAGLFVPSVSTSNNFSHIPPG